MEEKNIFVNLTIDDRIILYYRSRDQDVQFLNRLSKIYLLLNLFVYSIYVLLLILLFTLPTEDIITIVHPIEVKTHTYIYIYMFKML